MNALYALLGLTGIGTLLLAIRSGISWLHKEKLERITTENYRAERERKKERRERLTAKQIEEANEVLKTLPLEPSDEEAERLLREAQARLKRD